ncbi:hypothetical protein HII31_13486 [Pseudocercospora fuligena]|uniref:Uncharacterized protein n=1 Tax=Pseudocercospora fuligena TaxID=685502 RepID=A0A8H6R816_9PEZI|nr:hypothetical protein HII31_13486 [Pseudocercospora fuligena]
MANEAAPAPLTDQDLKDSLPLLATQQKYNAGYKKKRLPPSHNDSPLPAIHCLEHEVKDHYKFNLALYPSEREAGYQNNTEGEYPDNNRGEYPQRHWFRPEDQSQRKIKGFFSWFLPNGPTYTFHVFDESSSNPCIYEDPERDIKRTPVGDTKRACIFIEQGESSAVQQPYLLRATCSISLKDACTKEMRNNANIQVQAMREALKAWKVSSDLKIAYGWHGKIQELPFWDWEYLKQNWKHQKDLQQKLKHRPKEER